MKAAVGSTHQTVAQPQKKILPPLEFSCQSGRCISSAKPYPNWASVAKATQLIWSMGSSLLGSMDSRSGRKKQVHPTIWHCPHQDAVPQKMCQRPLTCMRPGPAEQTAGWPWPGKSIPKSQRSSVQEHTPGLHVTNEHVSATRMPIIKPLHGCVLYLDANKT